jgi:O-antigen ligase
MYLSDNRASKAPSWIEYAFVSYLLYLSSEAFGFIIVIMSGGGIVQTSSNPILRVLWIVAYVGSATILVAHRHLIFAAISRNWAVFLVPGFAVASTVWSIEIASTMPQAANLGLTTLIGIYIGTRFSVLAIMRIVFFALGFSVIASFLVSLAHLPFALMPDGSARGLFTHKNMLGMQCGVVYSVSVLFAWRGVHRWSAIVLTIISLVTVFMARSSTSLLAITFITAILPIMLVSQESRASGLIVACVLLVATLVVFLIVSGDPGGYWAWFTQLLSRDSSLSGRDLLWAPAINNIQDRPLLGTGYAAFWPGALDWQFNYAISKLGEVGHVHNNVLQVGLELGLIGVAFAALTIAVATGSAFALMVRGKDSLMCWPIVLIVMLTLYTSSEVILFRSNRLAQFVLVALMAYGTEVLAPRRQIAADFK